MTGHTMICFVFLSKVHYVTYGINPFNFPKEKKTKNTLYNFGVCTKAIYKDDMSLLLPLIYY